MMKIKELMEFVVKRLAALLVAVCMLSSCGEESRLHNPYQFNEDGTLNCSLPYETQIEEDLRVFQGGDISAQQVEKIYSESVKDRVLVSISDSKIDIKESPELNLGQGRVSQVRSVLTNLVRRFEKLPKATFVVNLRDELQSARHSQPFPIFSFQKSKKFYDINFPYPPSFLDFDGHIDKIRSVKISWSQKRRGLVWRGSQTGGQYTGENWRSFPRSMLVLKCVQIPERCDAGFSSYTQVDAEAKQSIDRELGLKSSIPLEGMQQWRYIASLDGNGWADRFSRLLASSSLVFKQESENYEFFESVVKPDTHYLPIKHDISDLNDKLDWANEHPLEVSRMIERSNKFVRENMRQEQVDCYLYNLLVKYGELQK